MAIRFIIDIDDTIFISERYNCKECGRMSYKKAVPVADEIDMVNELYDLGHHIILHTGRGWESYEMTVAELKRLGVKYNNLVMGKPQGFYIDRTHNFSSVYPILKLIKEGKLE